MARATAKRGERTALAKVQTVSASKVDGLVLGRIASALELDMFNGYFARVYPPMVVNGTTIYINPDPIVNFEAGLLGTGIYDETMDKDSHLSGAWDARVNAVVSLPWTIEAEADDPTSRERAQVIQDIIEAVPDLEDMFASMLMAVMRGFDVCEPEYKIIRATGGVGIKRVHNLPPDAFVFDVDWNPRMRTSKAPLTGEELPARKFMVTRYRPRMGNPYGTGIGRNLWWPAWFKKNGVKFWLVYCEKFGMPTILGKYPKNTAPADKTKFLNVLRSVQRETAITMDDDMEATLLEATRQGQATVYEQLANFLNAEMSKRILGQTLTTESNPGTGSGSFALGKVHGDVRQDILESDALLIERSMNDGLVRWLYDFNFGEPDDEDSYPRFRMSAEPPEDLTALSTQLSNLVGLGVPIALKDIMARFKLRMPEDGEQTLNDLKAQQDAQALQRAMASGLPVGPGDGNPNDPNAPGGNKPPQPKGKGDPTAAVDAQSA